MCINEAKKYKTRNEFYKKSRGAYSRCLLMGYMDNVCSHMVRGCNNRGHWNEDRCRNEALKYGSRSEFKNNSSAAYEASRINGWLDNACLHMFVIGDMAHRYLYAIVKDKSIYFGITFDPRKREKEHALGLSRSTEKLNGNFEFHLLTKYPIDVNLALSIEKELIKVFSNNSHLELLNKSSGGEFGGGGVKWTKDICKAISTQYKNKGQFYMYDRNAYEASLRNGWINEFFKI